MKKLITLGILLVTSLGAQLTEFPSSGSGSGAADTSTGLVHHWAMEAAGSGDATSVTDAGSAEEDLTCTNTPQWSATTCAVGSNCIDFTSSSSEYCQTATSPTIPTGDSTFSIWMRPDAIDSALWAIMDGSGGNEYVVIVISSTGLLQPSLNNVTLNLTESGAVATGEWYHVAIVRENYTHFIYINGRLAATRFSGALSFSTCQILVGVDADATCNGSLGNYFDGQLDDFRIYSRALSRVDVEALYGLGN